MNDGGRRVFVDREDTIEAVAEGEGFAGAVTLDAIARFLTHSRDDVLRTLTELVTRGDVTCDAGHRRVSAQRK